MKLCSYSVILQAMDQLMCQRTRNRKVVGLIPIKCLLKIQKSCLFHKCSQQIMCFSALLSVVGLCENKQLFACMFVFESVCAVTFFSLPVLRSWCFVFKKKPNLNLKCMESFVNLRYSILKRFKGKSVEHCTQEQLQGNEIIVF